MAGGLSPEQARLLDQVGVNQSSQHDAPSAGGQARWLSHPAARRTASRPSRRRRSTKSCPDAPSRAARRRGLCLRIVLASAMPTWRMWFVQNVVDIGTPSICRNVLYCIEAMKLMSTCTTWSGTDRGIQPMQKNAGGLKGHQVRIPAQKAELFDRGRQRFRQHGAQGSTPRSGSDNTPLPRASLRRKQSPSARHSPSARCRRCRRAA